jgi:phosphoenolpyruvate carboxykinase (GTP)
VNYFLRDNDGQFVNAVRDKHVWIKWMELRVHGDVGAIRSPTGRIPRFDDLQPLFKQVLGKDYAREDYVKQFAIRVPENLEKLDRVEEFHHAEVTDAPPVLSDILTEQRTRLLEIQKQFGDYVSPESLPLE